MSDLIKRIKNKNIHVVGASGTEGSAILEFLSKNGIKNITAHDFSVDENELKVNFFKTHLWLKGKEKQEALDVFLKLPINLKLKDKYLEGILDADIIFVPSSWRLYKPNFPLLERAEEKGIEFDSLTKLYFSLAKGKIISITGTKGKGTTSRLIYEILSGLKKDRDICLAGNDRRSAQELAVISEMGKDDILIHETSNRQLMVDLGKSPDIGVITNISPDHIDEHGSFEKYIEIKKSLFKYQKEGDIAVLNYDNEITRGFGRELLARGIKVYFFSRKEKTESGSFIADNKIYVAENGSQNYIADLSAIKLVGEHNIENVLAAVLVGYLAGSSPEEIKKAIRGFKGLPHRIEFVGDYDGAKFYDDLASTNPESTVAAIKAMQGSRIILIGGGDDKRMDYAELVKEILGKVNLFILLPGSGSEEIITGIMNYELRIKNKNQKSKQSSGLSVFECNNFAEALEFANKNKKAGDVVLISPACAHFQARYIDVLKKPIRNLIVEKFS